MNMGILFTAVPYLTA